MSLLKYGSALTAIALLTACSAANDVADTVQAEAGSAAEMAKDAVQTAVTGGSFTLESPKVKALLAKFDMNSVVGTPTIAGCTVGDGRVTQCLSIELPLYPKGYEIGPWCPRTIEDGPEESGIWIKDGQHYDATGEFITNLADFYGDPDWKLYDEDTGLVRYTSTLESCVGAAKPDVEPEYTQNCIECLMEFMDPDMTHTWPVVLEPAKASTTTATNNYGAAVAFSGVLLNGRAPIEAIIRHHTIAVFDDCGGHANPNEGYHVHAVTEADNCLKQIASTGGHAPEIGIAMDGYMIHTRKNLDDSVPADLDTCGGHEYGELGYHYHADVAGSNAILGCLSGEVGEPTMTHGPDTSADGGMGGMGPRPDAH